MSEQKKEQSPWSAGLRGKLPARLLSPHFSLSYSTPSRRGTEVGLSASGLEGMKCSGFKKKHSQSLVQGTSGRKGLNLEHMGICRAVTLLCMGL